MARSGESGGHKEAVNGRNAKRNNEKYALKTEATCSCETFSHPLQQQFSSE
jgi:hypothetical protein